MDKLELKNIAVEQGLDFDGVIELVFDAQQAKVDELQKRVDELQTAFKQLIEMENESISFEHDLFDN